jgi:hypothetical protein
MANGVKFGRKPKLSAYQRAEAIKRRAAGETLAEIARSYAAVSLSCGDAAFPSRTAGACIGTVSRAGGRSALVPASDSRPLLDQGSEIDRFWNRPLVRVGRDASYKALTKVAPLSCPPVANVFTRAENKFL